MGAQLKARTAACVSIAAVAGCTQAGFCVQPLVKGIPPTSATLSWDFASQKRCRKNESLSLNHANVYEEQIFSPSCCSGSQLRVHSSSCANKPIDDESDCCSRIRWSGSLKIRRHAKACAKRKRDVDSSERCRSQSCR